MSIELEDLTDLKFEDCVSLQEAIEMLGDEDIFYGCLKSFATMFKESFTEMHNDWRKQDVQACYQSAHKFKGATAYACCPQMLTSLKFYNQECRSGNMDKGNDFYEQVLLESRKVSHVLTIKYELTDNVTEYINECSKFASKSNSL
jgi:hypothetical protein